MPYIFAYACVCVCGLIRVAGWGVPFGSHQTLLSFLPQPRRLSTWPPAGTALEDLHRMGWATRWVWIKLQFAVMRRPRHSRI